MFCSECSEEIHEQKIVEILPYEEFPKSFCSYNCSLVARKRKLLSGGPYRKVKHEKNKTDR